MKNIIIPIGMNVTYLLEMCMAGTRSYCLAVEKSLLHQLASSEDVASISRGYTVNITQYPCKHNDNIPAICIYPRNLLTFCKQCLNSKLHCLHNSKTQIKAAVNQEPEKLEELSFIIQDWTPIHNSVC